MATITDSSLPMGWVTVADLWDRLGGIPLDRICLVPAPGKATEQDVLDWDDHADRICELIDGTLVAKTTGFIVSARVGHVPMTRR